MLKKLNQFLKLFGFNLVHARRPKASYRVHVPIEDANTGRTHDDCPGGHSDCAPKQPNSDNNVTGQTS